MQILRAVRNNWVPFVWGVLIGMLILVATGVRTVPDPCPCELCNLDALLDRTAGILSRSAENE